MKKDVRNAWVISSIIFVSLLVMGGVYHNVTVKKLGKEYVYTLTQSEARIAELESGYVTEYTLEEVKPIVVFKPSDAFTQAERELLNTRLINPVADYYSMERDMRIFSIAINKLNIDSYLYSVQISSRGNGTEEVPENMFEWFFFGEKGKEIQYWQPLACVGGCKFSEEYKAKYPHVR